MATESTRSITDLKTLAAMAHPVRRRLMDVLTVDGPSTASMLAERTGEAVGNVSYHLRTLAECELIEAAPELARDRRERWWRLVSATVRWSSRDLPQDAATEIVERAATATNLERHVRHIQAWNTADAQAMAPWPTGPFSTTKWLRMSDSELAELAAQMQDVLERWGEREIPDDGQQRDTVLAFAYGIPARP